MYTQHIFWESWVYWGIIDNIRLYYGISEWIIIQYIKILQTTVESVGIYHRILVHLTVLRCMELYQDIYWSWHHFEPSGVPIIVNYCLDSHHGGGRHAIWSCNGQHLPWCRYCYQGLPVGRWVNVFYTDPRLIPSAGRGREDIFYYGVRKSNSSMGTLAHYHHHKCHYKCHHHHLSSPSAPLIRAIPSWWDREFGVCLSKTQCPFGITRVVVHWDRLVYW